MDRHHGLDGWRLLCCRCCLRPRIWFPCPCSQLADGDDEPAPAALPPPVRAGALPLLRENDARAARGIKRRGDGERANELDSIGATAIVVNSIVRSHSVHAPICVCIISACCLSAARPPAHTAFLARSSPCLPSIVTAAIASGKKRHSGRC